MSKTFWCSTKRKDKTQCNQKPSETRCSNYRFSKEIKAFNKNFPIIVSWLTWFTTCKDKMRSKYHISSSKKLFYYQTKLSLWSKMELKTWLLTSLNWVSNWTPLKMDTCHTQYNHWNTIWETKKLILTNFWKWNRLHKLCKSKFSSSCLRRTGTQLMLKTFAGLFKQKAKQITLSASPCWMITSKRWSLKKIKTLAKLGWPAWKPMFKSKLRWFQITWKQIIFRLSICMRHWTLIRMALSIRMSSLKVSLKWSRMST